MDILGGAIEPGRRFRLALNLIFIALFAVLAVFEPEHRYISMFLVCIGIGGLAANLRRGSGRRASVAEQRDDY